MTHDCTSGGLPTLGIAHMRTWPEIVARSGGGSIIHLPTGTVSAAMRYVAKTCCTPRLPATDLLLPAQTRGRDMPTPVGGAFPRCESLANCAPPTYAGPIWAQTPAGVAPFTPKKAKNKLNTCFANVVPNVRPRNSGRELSDACVPRPPVLGEMHNFEVLSCVRCEHTTSCSKFAPFCVVFLWPAQGFVGNVRFWGREPYICRL